MIPQINPNHESKTHIIIIIILKFSLGASTLNDLFHGIKYLLRVRVEVLVLGTPCLVSELWHYNAWGGEDVNKSLN